jgi:hypothetical protein
VNAISRLTERIPAPAEARKYIDENGPGILVSAIAHGLVLLLLLHWVRSAPHTAPENLRTVLVDIIHLGEETAAPPAPLKSQTPQQQAFARRASSAHSPDIGVLPNPHPAVHDDFQNRLNALSKLRAPETDTRALHGQGETEAQSTTNDAESGDDATYSLRDYIRAQVLRRWNLDLSAPGGRAIIVALRVVMMRNGSISLAEIVDKHRYATDAAYREIAMSARNAVLLSSPIQLPPGNYPAETEMTIRLDPRDALH